MPEELTRKSDGDNEDMLTGDAKSSPTGIREPSEKRTSPESKTVVN